MTKDTKVTTTSIPEPVEGKTVFQITSSIRIRFNADGWVEEIGKGGPDDLSGTILQGRTGSKLDDVCARRFYDLLTRAVIIDIYPRRPSDLSGSSGLILFKDLDPDSPLYDRVKTIIDIANHHFNMKLKPLA